MNKSDDRKKFLDKQRYRGLDKIIKEETLKKNKPKIFTK
jgi:hypothetical protein